MGASLLFTGNIAEGRAQFDQATALYDPADHRPLATRFGVDSRMAVISYRSGALWCLGYPEAALADADQALSNAREIGHAATLMHALHVTSLTLIHCGSYAAARSRVDEVVTLADEKGALFWKLLGMLDRGCLLTSTGEASRAVVTDANHFLYLCKAVQLASVDPTKIKAPRLVLYAPNDLIFYEPIVEDTIKNIAAAGTSVESGTLTGPNGHLNGIAQIGQGADKITAFLAE
jgi:hypothetical protein